MKQDASRKRRLLMERKGAVTFKGTPMTLLGPELKTGATAPDFTAIDKGMTPVRLADFGNKAKLISVTPSLDTPVCDAQARRFNEEAAKLPPGIVVMNISMDLPFAINRFCTTAGIARIKTLSDYRKSEFGMSYGVMIKELRLLARSIFLLDADNTVIYAEVVREITENVDFDRALDAARKLLSARA